MEHLGNGTRKEFTGLLKKYFKKRGFPSRDSLACNDCWDLKR